MQVVVCHEVEKPDWVARCRSGWKETNQITSSFKAEITSSSSRVFGIKVSDLPLVTALYRISRLSTAGVAFAYLIEFSFDRCLLVLGYRLSNPTQRKLNHLRRPGLNAQRAIFDTLNLNAKDNATVYSTMVSEGHLDVLEHGVANDGWLHLEMHENTPEIAFEYIRELCVWVAIERSLINASIAELVRKPRRFDREIPRLLRVNKWLRDSITNPPVDKSVFIKHMNDLRVSLNLVALRNELGDRSDRASQTRNVALAGLGLATTAVFSILAFLFPPAFEWFR